ncbi:Panacea domain-containing protein [Rhizobium sp.]|jgi:uncharacterized phage-associated protein|uniref:Panacea domain-containing protein n=1 Tax=Rhizobium sp. TaxID=391 RepID=UPI000E8E7A99|nr:hypothetical protein [Rhizobium sp.]
MPNHKAVAIANEFLKLRADNTWPRQMYIQKLCHIANGWMLAVSGQPLIEEVPEAWDNGPVFRSIWKHIKEYGYRGQYNTLMDPDNQNVVEEQLTDDEKQVIKHVWDKYGHLSAAKLSQLTHEPNTPWEKAYFNKGRNSPLDLDDIKNHYIDLAMAGRAGV